MKSFKELIDHRFLPELVEYDPNKRLHKVALRKLILDFLDIDKDDQESKKYSSTKTAYLLQKKGEFVAALIYRDLPEDSTVAYIRALTVLSTERRKGYGYALLLGFIGSCQRKGTYRTIQLAANADNFAAIALYKQLGFIVVKEGVDEGRKFLCMELTLTK